MKNISKKNNYFLLAGLLLVAFSTNTLAQEMPQKGPIPFSIYDVNNDGKITQTEFYDAREKRMSAKAAQGKVMRKAGNAPDYSFFDTNGDGSVTKMELLEGQNKMMRNKKQNKGNKQKGMRNY